MTDNIKEGGFPKSELELTTLLKKAYAFAVKGQHGLGIAICDFLVNDPACFSAAIRKRSQIYEHSEDIQSAIFDLELITNGNSEEPADFFSLGRLLIETREYAKSVSPLEMAIEISNREHFTYYKESSKFLLAYALIKLGKISDASKIVETLPPTSDFYIPNEGMITFIMLRSMVNLK